jgi:DNA-binding HxlR family transcriptional regulator
MSVSKKEVGECPVDAMMRVMDGRWKGTILHSLLINTTPSLSFTKLLLDLPRASGAE